MRALLGLKIAKSVKALTQESPEQIVKRKAVALTTAFPIAFGAFLLTNIQSETVNLLKIPIHKVI